ncbi:MAG TPA: peptidylprolyl isomerase [Actinomycetota bacterium]|nr:peptidylprolyl isomerase [Actinomycetota bacterium]
MANKRTRDRQLAKLAARRQQERLAAKRRRDIALGVIGTLVAGVLLVVGWRLLTRDAGEDAGATATPSVSAAPSGAPEVTGEVQREVEPPDEVACGGDMPPTAGDPRPQYSHAPGADLLDPDVRYRATVETSCGTIVLDLDARRAPLAVSSFVFLSREGFYDGLTVHRVATDYVIQAGSSQGGGQGGPGYTFADELGGRMRYEVGTLAMANAGANTNGSQWFIVSGPEGSNLDQIPNYTIFGEVVDGLDVVETINDLPVVDGTDRPTQAVYIGSVTIDERPVAQGPDGASPTPGDEP